MLFSIALKFQAHALQLVPVGGYNAGGYAEAYGVYVNSNHAFVAVGQGGMQIINIANPTNATLEGSLGAWSYCYNVCVPSTKAYLTDGSFGMRVINVTNVSNPWQSGYYQNVIVAYDVKVDGNYAYLTDGSAGGFKILDVSSATPTRKGGVTVGSMGAYGVDVVGSKAYVAAWKEGLRVVDISSPTNPVIVGTCQSISNVWGVFVVGNYAYVADGTNGLRVVDVSNPANPTLVAGYKTGGQGRNVACINGYAYLADGTNGLQAIDINDPLHPTLAASYVGTNANEAIGVFADWDYIYVAYGRSGLVILAAVGGVAPTITTSSPLPDGTVGAFYTQTLAASGGVTPYTWTNSSGSLPAGLSLSSGGLISGTPSAVTNANFTVKAIGNNGPSSTKSFNLTINQPGDPHAFYCETNDSTITIYYIGSGGAVVIPSMINGLPVTSIGDQAFYFCDSLTSITIPNSVTNIGNMAFANCTSLTNVTIPNSVINVGDYAFDYCTSLTAITVDTANLVYSSVAGVLFDKGQKKLIQCPPITGGSYTIPNSVISIGVGAFSYCQSLAGITIPNGVTSIGDRAFFDCQSLAGITIPNSVTNIGSNAFESCSGLSSITIPNGVTSIGSGTFYYCTSITNVMIGNNVTSIGYASFDYCTSLTSVTIPNSVTHIGDYAFYYCLNLTNVIIGNSVISIGAWAFRSCSMTGVTIPNSVTSIGDNAFYNCYLMKGICFQGNAPTLGGTNVFYNDNKVSVYYLPGTTGWGALFGGRPAFLWNPQVQTSDASFGVRTNRFGFNLIGSSNLVIVVEACTNLASSIWNPVQTNILTGGVAYFSDVKWTNSTRRFYRIRSP